MCGIIGYVGDEDALPIVRDGLKNLEYRGYDSAGVVVQDAGDRTGTDLQIYKQSGEIDDLVLPTAVDARLALGHTRWSTHGPPTDENAHPHSDCTGEVAAVHNGIIDNYAQLREELIEGGHTFTSDTDTEVVPHLLEDALEEAPLVDALKHVVDRISGSYAIAATAADQEGIVVARQDSPLVVGLGDSETFVASDVPAFLEHTREVLYLEDGDVAHLTDGGVTVYHDNETVTRETRTVDWEAESAEKGGYEHYMLKEIHEQPTSLRQCLSGRIDEVQGAVDLDVDLPEEFLQSLEEVQFVAAGTSYHAGLYGARLFEEYADVRATAHVASEYDVAPGSDPWRTLGVAVTQSGETADTLSAIRKADRRGVTTLAVTNTVGSTVTRDADETAYIRAGPEIGVAATKTFVSQVATLALLAGHVGRARGAIATTELADLLSDVRSLPGAVQQVLDHEDEIRAIAETYAESDAFFYIGRQYGHPVALESALKLKEISYDHAEGFPGGELKHGPLALVTDNTPVLAVLTAGSAAEATLNNVKEVAARGAPIIGASSIDDVEGYLDARIDVPDAGVLEPVVAAVAFQLFAYHVARLKDRPIDKPRNLAKSVTVE
jgi:glucosamine--fructose-6-phosphate aminotransferase (isomerizing)